MYMYIYAIYIYVILCSYKCMIIIVKNICIYIYINICNHVNRYIYIHTHNCMYKDGNLAALPQTNWAPGKMSSGNTPFALGCNPSQCVQTGGVENPENSNEAFF